MHKSIILISLLLLTGCATKSLQIQTDLVSNPGFDNHQSIERLSKAIQIPTVSYSDSAKTEAVAFNALFRFMEESFPLVNSHLKLDVVNEWSLLYTWEGTKPDLNPVVLLAHTDVVPADTTSASRWRVHPFAGHVSRDTLWGRGTVDDKAGVFGILEAVEFLLSKDYTPERTVFIAIGHDEEIGGMNGARFLAQTLKDKHVTPDLIMDEGGAIVEEGVPGVDVPVALIGIAEKGYMSLEISAEGLGGHSSMPPKETAVTVVSKAVAALSDHPMNASLEGPIKEMMITLAPETSFPFNFLFSNLWAFGGIIEGQLAASSKSNALIRTTTAPTMFYAGTKDNQLPQKASAVVNFRIKPGDTVDGIISHVKTAINDPRVTVRPIGDFPTSPSDVSHYKSEQYDAIAKSVRQTFPDVIVSPYLTVGGTDAKHYQGMCDQIYRFLPIQFSPAQLDGMHGVDEHISFLDYERVILFYIQLIRNSTGPERLW